MKLRIAVGLLAVAFLGVAVAADKPADVRDLMTANQFHVTGLDARSAEQLAAFGAWLASYPHSSPAGSADVRDLMSARQFHATGLDMLSPEQLAAFNAWLAAYTHSVAAGTGGASSSVAVPVVVPAAPTPAPVAATNANSFGGAMLTPAKRDEPKRIESTIPGHFTGWTGATVFTLANGQVWKQAESGYFQANLQDPTVVIKRLAFGYLLTLPGEGATVFVTRVR
jgi:hypothetical protein